MPKANNTTKTMARLAMGTAILTVIAGCENRAATGYNDFVSLPETAVAPASAPVAPAVTITVPQYVAPGAPTYSEPTRAANIQTFETVYGQPVADAASGTLTTAAPYTPPSYNDGSVTVQSLPALSSGALPELATFSETVIAPSYDIQKAPAAATESYSITSDVTEGLVYGENLTSSSYSIAAAPLDPLPASPLLDYAVQPAPVPAVASDSYLVEPMPMPVEVMPAETMPMESMSFEALPLETTTMAVEPMPMELTTLDSTTFDAMPVEAAPMAFDTLSAIDALPVTEAAAPAFEPMPVQAQATPVFGSISAGGMQVIDNQEAVATYNPAPAMIAPSTFATMDAPAMQPPALDTMEPVGFDAQNAAIAMFETTPLPAPAPRLETTPLPTRKTYKTAALAPAATNSPLTAPLPRPRPAAVVAKKTLSSPLPQPRPDYRAPMAVATTAGKYVSVGAIGEWQDEAPATIAATPAAPIAPKAPEQPAVQEASISTLEITAPALGTPTDLSGTSWKLVKLGDRAIDVNTELHFDDASAFAGGQGPCNSYGGEFMDTGDGSFSMANIFATKTACSNLDLENSYIDTLKMAGRYEIAADFSEMVLRDGAGKPIARFTAF